MHTIKQILSPLRVFFFLVLYSSCSYSATVVLNGGFEDGVLSPWYQGIGTLDYTHDEFWNISSNRSFTGNYSVTNVGNNELRQNFTPIAASQITEVSFYLLKESFAVDSAVQLHYSDGTQDQLLVSNTGTDIWEHMNITGSLDLNKNLSGISFFGIRSSDPGGIRLYLDDINIIATPLPAGIWFFISGLLGLIGIARHNKAL
jgi:hypothetical protein